MGRLLDRLLTRSEAHDVEVEGDGYMLVARPGQGDGFNALVREAAARSGEDFVVFTTPDRPHVYSRMFVLPLPPMA
ncbi:hypothetical protein [Brevundimonas sp. GCM10030266]|uniref:hypothetical protein n=1 Tax=Brevundimonas sp. GCM10030266 TaxID=3273386 RepID=UPI0036062BEA